MLWVLIKLRKVIRSRGVWYTLASLFRMAIVDTGVYWGWHAWRRNTAQFVFQKKQYPYLIHRYNATWRNERAVEIPIALEHVSRYPSSAVLEVGNVLSHYTALQHTVVDKYDAHPRVIRKDILDYHSPHAYEFIISVSTVEHIGWDEETRDPSKALRALEHMFSLLSPGGACLVTLPYGYNAYIDQMIRDELLPFQKMFCMKRVSRDNCWQEVSRQDILNAQYGVPFAAANAIVIGFYARLVGRSQG